MNFNIGLLFFGSGICSLVYQVIWLREFRLIFGSSTAATGAVLAIFMGGIGIGGIIFGKNSEKHKNPLLLYANLEILIVYLAALSPFLLIIIKNIYIWLGGSISMGKFMSTIVRLFFSTIVIGLPAFLMGGTLPALAKALVTDEDKNRKTLAVLYGLNTMGAVIGTILPSFFMIEAFGMRNTLWAACFLNLIIAVTARILSCFYKIKKPLVKFDDAAYEKTGFIFIAAFITGFAFLLMEIVWYRMLIPILGGTTYTFGLILSVALLGIGIGAILYTVKNSKAIITNFSLTCGLEALFISITYAIGDKLAIIAALLRPLGAIGFIGLITGWLIITSIVILPAAIVAGFQLPLLVAIMGKGRDKIGKHTGNVYACNTIGSIAGSIAGGFGFLPFFSATGTWKLVILILSILCFITVFFAYNFEKKKFALILPVAASITAIILLFSEGPSAAWKHGSIGVGRADLMAKDRNGIYDWINERKRDLIWEKEGIESNIGLCGNDGYSFFINGATDGNVKVDASTSVGLGLISAVLHPKPEKALVIGLGTGSSAGWIGDVKSIQKVDVVEFEPNVIKVARQCSPVNRNAMNNPKVNVIIADAREQLLTCSEKYDLIISEPSNPHRAGVSSLYTVEFYKAVGKRMKKGAIFSQWIQAYEVDAQTIRTIYATLVSVFPKVETWQTNPGDILLICSMEDINYSVPFLKNKIMEEPFYQAFLAVWGTVDIEGFLSRFVAQSYLAEFIAYQESKKELINTDNKMIIEFAFARTVGRKWPFSIEDIYQEAVIKNVHRPFIKDGLINWDNVDRNRFIMYLIGGNTPYKKSIEFTQKKPEYPFEIAVFAESMADIANDEAIHLIDKLRVLRPLEADAILSRFLFKKKDYTKAYETLEKMIIKLRTEPWYFNVIISHSLQLGIQMSKKDLSFAKKMVNLLSVPFCVNILNNLRLKILMEISSIIDYNYGSLALKNFEPYIPWNEQFLNYRYQCYKETKNPLLNNAEKDLKQFLKYSSKPFST